MKKSLSKILARMAKDGDVETVAEFIEEMLEPETAAEEPAEEVAEAVAEAAEEPAAVVETPEGTTVVVDQVALGDILSRLDQIIALLTPAASDEDPVEEIAEAVEEVIEAVTAAEEEAAPAAEEEVAEILESILEPAVSTTLEEGEGDADPEDPENRERPCGDALKSALLAVRPALEKMSPRQRKKAARDIAARMPRTSPNGKDSVYAARKKPPFDYADLGKRIMAKRNPNSHA